MTTDPLNRYASMMHEVTAPDALSEKVLTQMRAQETGDRTDRSPKNTPQPATTRTAPISRTGRTDRIAAASARPSKPFRVRTLAIAACSVLALGLGVLTVAPLVPALDGADSASSPAFANVFGLAVAEAAESGQSVALATDESGITLAGTGGFDIRFGMNLTCTGEGIRHLSYHVEGDDVRFMSLDMSGDHPDMDLPESFEVDYSDQNPPDLHRELLVNMGDPAIDEIKGQIQELSTQIDATENADERVALEAKRDDLHKQEAELHNAYYADVISGNVDDNTWLASKITGAAQKLGNATLSVTATFADGTTATKQYRISPVENFESTCKTHLDASMGTAFSSGDGTANPRLTAPLFTIAEIA